MSDQDNYFARLNAINVSDHIEKKGGFSYLSWPYAVSQLRLADPTATWTVCRFDGKPYLLCEAGVFVEVAVTVQGITLSQIHPVLDGRNRPIAQPTAFDVNTSIQRALVKAIALHGLGLYNYAGEDLPQPINDTAANDAASVDDWADLTPDRLPAGRPASPVRISKGQQTHIHKLAIEVGISLDRVLSYFGVADLGDIAATDFLRVIRSLEKRRKAA
jgi:hypothetical protein